LLNQGEAIRCLQIVLIVAGLGFFSAINHSLVSAGEAGSGSPAWTPVAPMAKARTGHTATFLWGPACPRGEAPSYCGQILVAGGKVGEPFPGDPDPAGHPYGDISSAELFDPNTARWSATGRLHYPRSQHNAGLLPDGKVAVWNGPPAPPLVPIEIYDPATQTWLRAETARGVNESAAIIEGGRCGSNCGKLLVIKEVVGAKALAEKLDPKANVARRTNSPSILRLHPATASIFGSGCKRACGSVLLAGGSDLFSKAPAASSAELFDPQTEKWQPTVRLLIPALFPVATTLSDGRVLLSHVTDKTTDALLLKGPVQRHEVFDPVSKSWAVTGSSKTVSPTAPTALPDGRAIIVGGVSGPAGSPVGSAELYFPDLKDPETGARGTWRPIEPPATARFGAAATVIACGSSAGQVLVTGGAADVNGPGGAFAYSATGSQASAEIYTKLPHKAGPECSGQSVDLAGSAPAHTKGFFPKGLAAAGAGVVLVGLALYLLMRSRKGRSAKAN